MCEKNTISVFARRAEHSLQNSVAKVIERHRKDNRPLVMVTGEQTVLEDPHKVLTVHEEEAEYKVQKKKK